MADHTHTRDGSAVLPTVSPLLDPKESRLAFFDGESGGPKFPATFRFYKQIQASHWTTDEHADILKEDQHQWSTLEPRLKRFARRPLGFFLYGDELVMRNLSNNVMGVVTMPEALAFYREQAAQETTHAEAYSLQVFGVMGRDEARSVERSAKDWPEIAHLISWADSWMSPAVGFWERLLAFGLGRYLERQGGYHIYNVSYASTRGDVATHARCLAQVIDHLEAVEEISFVGHSLGNLVVRYYLAELAREGKDLPPAHRIHRIVMLAPPNNGAVLAERFGRNKVFELIAGASGTQIASTWAELEGKLAVPACPFGIVAGGGAQRDLNPLVSGADDLVVSVEEARLPGARDFIVLPVFHTYLMDNERVQACTLNFLQHRYFVAETQRQPIPR